MILLDMINKINMIFILTLRILLKPHAEPQSRRENLKPRRSQRNFAGSPHACAASTQAAYSYPQISQIRKIFKTSRRAAEPQRYLLHPGSPHACAASTPPAYSLNNTFSSPSAPLRLCERKLSLFSLTTGHGILPMSSPWEHRRPACILNHESHKKNPSAPLRLCERKFSLFSLFILYPFSFILYPFPSPHSLIPASTHGGPK